MAVVPSEYDTAADINSTAADRGCTLTWYQSEIRDIVILNTIKN